MKSLRDCNVVITGAGSGIGRALAEQAAREGARLALCDWNEAGLRETATTIGGAVLHEKVDVRSEEGVRSFAERVERELGGAHVVVNNAGVSVSEQVGAMKREDFEWLFDVNFWGVVRCTEAFLPQLRRQRAAHLVNISSIFGIIAVPSQSAYNASKFAVRGYTEALRQELADTAIRVTCVHPGGVRTNICANGRQYSNLRGEPTSVEELSETFAKLARTSPEKAAETIWAAVRADAPRVLVGSDARFADLVQRVFPTRYPAVLRGFTALLERATGSRV